jgi:hypothetical protein
MSKGGRPPGAQNKVGNEEKEFIKQLLGETRKQYHDYFLELANSADKGKKARFANIRTELSKMIVPKPVEVDHSINESDFQALRDIFGQWLDDEEEE